MVAVASTFSLSFLLSNNMYAICSHFCKHNYCRDTLLSQNTSLNTIEPIEFLLGPFRFTFFNWCLDHLHSNACHV